MGRFFSHRAHRVNRAFLRTFRAHRTPPAYRVHRAFQLLSLLKRDITKPTSFLQGYLGDHSLSLRGRGRGRGHYLSEPCVFCSSVFSVRKNMSFFICHYVILSYKNHQFLSVPLFFCLQKKHLPPFVIMSLCLQKTSVSLRHSVILSSKKTSVSLSPSVILSKNAPVGDGSGPSCCCCYFFSFCLISAFHKLCYVLPHYLSSIYSF